MKTSINGKEAVWNDSIKALFEKHVPKLSSGQSISNANYFTSRPYLDEYNLGSDKAGFSYTLMPGEHVCQVQYTPALRAGLSSARRLNI